ncbi:hypothetical protein EDB83DRAFT_2325242 [Lactarius deliciosus]|nr:hypothetical protein EDB83DRAFT_2325242 [Lactarius deliciosus]
MAGSRKRAPSTPKMTPKRQKTTKKTWAKHLLGGALEMSFQLDGAPPPRPSQQNLEGEDAFAGSSPAQASNQGSLSSPQLRTLTLEMCQMALRRVVLVSGGSSDPPTPTHPSRRSSKAGSRLGSGFFIKKMHPSKYTHIVPPLPNRSPAMMIVEKPEFHHLCLLLHPELHDGDIPHRTIMQKCIVENSAVQRLFTGCLRIFSCLGRVSFTTDMWSDPDLKPYMAVTAHWVEQVQTQGGQQKLTLRADLIGFV